MGAEFIRDPGSSDGVPPWAARAGDFVFFSGGIASDPVTGVPPEIHPTRYYPYHGSSIDRQLRYIYALMDRVLKSGGSSIKRLVKISTYQTEFSEIDPALRMRREFFDVEEPPSSTLLMVPRLMIPGLTVSNDVVAVRDDAAQDRRAVHAPTDDSPLPMHDTIYKRPIFVQAVIGGGLMFTSGLTAATLLNKGYQDRPEAGVAQPWSIDYPHRQYDIKFETRLILEFLKSLLARVDTTLDHIVKAEIHMTRGSDIAGMNEAWAEVFGNDGPARSVYITDLAPTEQLIEIEVVTIDPKGPLEKTVVNAPGVPAHPSGAPHAVKAGPYVFLSSLLATDGENGLAPEARVNPDMPYHASSAKLQTEYMLDHIEAICQAAGTSVDQIVRRRAMYETFDQMGESEDAWIERYGSFPPSTFFESTGPLCIPGCTIGYDLIAYAD